MSFRPGPAAVWLVLGVTAVAAIAFWIPFLAYLILPVLVLAGAGAVSDWRLLNEASKSVTMKQELPATIGRGLEFEVRWTIDHRWRRDLFVQARFGLPDVAEPDRWIESRTIAADAEAHEADDKDPEAVVPEDCEFVGRFVIDQRGKYEFGPAWIRLRGPFALVERKQCLDEKGMIDVLPETFWTSQQLARDDSAEQKLLDQVSRSRQHGVGTEFESLAEFRGGDDPKRIDWRASARANRLIIRRFQVERHRDVMLIIDCGRLMASTVREAKKQPTESMLPTSEFFRKPASDGSKLDSAVDAALMLSRVALQSGDRCGLGVFDDHVLGYLPPVSGPQAMKSLVHGVYDLQSRWRESDFSQMFAMLKSRQQKRSLVVVLSDIASEETTQRFRSSLVALARQHVVLFAALKTPQLSAFSQTPVDDMMDAARRAVGFRLLRERERAMHSLQRSAVHVLDVEPNELTVPLINQYVELRSQNAL
ncbi:MAG: DUF58 domain-containing protein [Planctomycetota bacterium]